MKTKGCQELITIKRIIIELIRLEKYELKRKGLKWIMVKFRDEIIIVFLLVGPGPKGRAREEILITNLSLVVDI